MDDRIPQGSRRLVELLRERDEVQKKIQASFRDTRIAHGMTQSAFAAATNISQGYLSQIEAGTRTASSDALIKLQQFMLDNTKGE